MTSRPAAACSSRIAPIVIAGGVLSTSRGETVVAFEIVRLFTATARRRPATKSSPDVSHGKVPARTAVDPIAVHPEPASYSNATETVSGLAVYAMETDR